jgi:hypothetical protein
VEEQPCRLRLPDQLKVAVSPFFKTRGWYGVLCKAAAGKEAGVGANGGVDIGLDNGNASNIVAGCIGTICAQAVPGHV